MTKYIDAQRERFGVEALCAYRHTPDPGVGLRHLQWLHLPLTSGAALTVIVGAE